MNITYDILVEYKKITSFDMPGFFQAALQFLNSDYKTIAAYYSGEKSTISSNPFNNFEKIKLERDSAFESFNAHKQKLTNLKWFILVEYLEDIDSRLKTLGNINRWSRSSITKVAYDPSFQMDYVLKQNQTLESVSADVLGSNNPDDDWVDIALKNAIREEDYSLEGGTLFAITLDRAAGFNFKINSVVDIVRGKSIYGKDLDNNFGFDSDANDLKVLDYDATILQAATNLINLKINDIPSARNIGLQKSIVIGQSRALLNFPVITRQLSETFAVDDSLKGFAINKVSLEQDNVFVEWQVKSRLNEVIANEVVTSL